MNFNTEQLAFLMGAKKFSKPLAAAAIRWGIINPADQARWLAQLHVESDGFNHAAELTNYSAKGLLATFGPTKWNPKGRNGLRSLSGAQGLVRAGPRAVFNFVYGGTWGLENLGNKEPDDGWDFRGRSLIQTTGRDNYEATSMGMYGDRRLLENPDLLLIPEEAASAAGWYWNNRRLNGVTDVREVTREINPGLKHLDRRIAQTRRAMDLVDFLTRS